MGSHVLAPEKVRSERTTRGILAMFLVMAVLAAITITGSGIASAGTLGGSSGDFFGPRIIDGGADVNGDGRITSTDDSDGFFLDTDLYDGYLDCDAWGTTASDANDGDDGDGSDLTPDATDGGDDCVLRGFFEEGNDDIYIWVNDGHFAFYADSFLETERTAIPDGWRLPGRFDDASSWDDDTWTTTEDWAWFFVDGRLDYNHDGEVKSSSTDDDHSGFIDDLALYDGYLNVDKDGGAAPDSGDKCTSGCFWGYNVTDGKVQETGPEYPDYTGDTGPAGAAGDDGVSGRTTVTSSTSKNSLNKSKSAMCSSTTKVLGGGYNLIGDTATLAHLTVVANGPVSGGWRVRVIEATPTTGTWSIDVTAICAIA